ncbi:hypothetical protein [Mesorhizobium sp. B1-1-8]|uniref:hypothetical protein n=1 Tax=Mesorhizobium sp. B1-1-8 TaxID=2589976 RepID=UPI0039B0DE44
MAMILLSCNPDMQSCHPAETALYAGMAECSAALPARLAATGMIGRCQALSNSAAIGSGDHQAPARETAMVRVISGVGADVVSVDYLVPRAGTPKD